MTDALKAFMTPSAIKPTLARRSNAAKTQSKAKTKARPRTVLR